MFDQQVPISPCLARECFSDASQMLMIWSGFLLEFIEHQEEAVVKGGDPRQKRSGT